MEIKQLFCFVRRRQGCIFTVSFCCDNTGKDIVRWSETYIPTLRDRQSEAELESHQFLLRGGYIRKQSPGQYCYLPLMRRVMDNASKLFRSALVQLKAQEISLPLLRPAHSTESDYFPAYAVDRYKLRDHRNNELELGGRIAERVLSMVAGEIRSYRQLPQVFFEIGPSFLDDPKARFGLMRLREFIELKIVMLDTDRSTSVQLLERLTAVLKNISDILGLEMAVVPSVTMSHETEGRDFIALLKSKASDQTVLSCRKCGYQSNAEISPVKPPLGGTEDEPMIPIKLVSTPEVTTIDEITSFLKVEAKKVVKTLLYTADGKPVAALVRGDRDVSPAKLGRVLKADGMELATPEQVVQIFQAPVGFAGPVGLEIDIIVDPLVADLRNFVAGANIPDKHLINVNIGRDFEPARIVDISLSIEGDGCPECGADLQARHGILLGSSELLDNTNAETMNATVTSSDGTEVPIQASSINLDLSRLVQTTIENKTAEGEQPGWPISLAPAVVQIIPLQFDDKQQVELTTELSKYLETAGICFLVDDRSVRPGVKFHDADLLGLPIRVVFGQKSLSAGHVEFQTAGMKQPEKVPIEGIFEAVERAVRERK